MLVPDAQQYPFSAVALISFRLPGQPVDSNPDVCTGFLIGHNELATAAHCLYGVAPDAPPGTPPGFATDIYVFPQLNTSDYVPFGFCGADDAFVPTGWSDSGNFNYDYGGINLTCAADPDHDLAAYTGTFGFDAATPDELLVRHVGYPDLEPADAMWTSAGYIAPVALGAEYVTKIDSTDGESGGPFWETRDDGCEACARALMSAEANLEGERYNVATGIAHINSAYETYIDFINGR